MTQIEGYLVGNYGLGTLNIFMIMIIAAAIWSTFLAIISSLQKDSN
jgi:archaellin